MTEILISGFGNNMGDQGMYVSGGKMYLSIAVNKIISNLLENMQCAFSWLLLFSFINKTYIDYDKAIRREEIEMEKQEDIT